MISILRSTSARPLRSPSFDRGNAEDVQRPRPHLVGAELLRHGERSLGKVDCPGVFVAEHGEPRELAEDKRLRPRRAQRLRSARPPALPAASLRRDRHETSGIGPARSRLRRPLRVHLRPGAGREPPRAGAKRRRPSPTGRPTSRSGTGVARDRAHREARARRHRGRSRPRSRRRRARTRARPPRRGRLSPGRQSRPPAGRKPGRTRARSRSGGRASPPGPPGRRRATRSTRPRGDASRARAARGTCP